MKNTLLYTLILVVAVMLVVDIIVAFMSRRPYHVVHYDAVYEYGFTDVATFTTTTRVVFKKEEYVDSYLKSMSEGATAVIEKYFDDLGERLKRKFVVVSYGYETSKIDPKTLEINEVLVIKGVVRKKGDEFVASLGDVKINAVSDSSVEVVLPKEAKVIKTDPEPSERVEDDRSVRLFWKGEKVKRFPEVVYGKR